MSDPEFLLDYLDNLSNEPESDDDFEGYLEQDDRPIAYHSGHNYYELLLSWQRSRSLDNLLDQDELITDFLLPEASPSSPMQGQHASGSPSLISLPPELLRYFTVSFFFFLMQVTILVIAASFTASFGVIPDIRESSPVGFFRLLFGDAVLDLILRETTLYTEQYFERKREFLEAHLQAQAHEWRRAPLTGKEVEMFIALLIGIGICDYPTRIILFHVQLHDFLH